MKRRSPRLISTLLALCMALALLPGTAWAADIPAIFSSDCGDNLTWSYSNGVLTIQGRGPIYDYGEQQDGGYASYQKPWVDYEDQIRTVNIANGVTRIGSAAFSPFSPLGSALTSVTIPGSVTSIGDFAFFSCGNLTNLVIPDSVTSIGMRAFDGCSSLTSVVIPNGVTSIEYETFFECTGLTSVTIPDSVTAIGESAFYGCTSLTSVTIPDGITAISEGTFLNCSGLTSVTIPASVATIGDIAFAGCDSLKDVYYGGTESQWKQISIESSEFGNNDPLLKAAIHYNGGPSAEPTPAEPDGIGVTVGGKAVQWTDAAPFIDGNDRTMVPLRAVANAMSLEVEWDAAAREAIFTDGSKTIYFPIGSKTARTSEGGAVGMDTAAVIVNDRTYAPIRYLAEYFGHAVDWDGAARTVIIG